jgi:(p)ppGpp synthase/HD superfamily hydrolase
LLPRIQTNVQLYQQMRVANYAPKDVEIVHNAYSIAQQLFSARFRQSAKPFLCHLVGTASDLIHEAAEPDVLAAALLHAAYTEGDFGYVFIGHKKDSKRKRRWLAARVGENAEHYVQCYTHMLWSSDSIPHIKRNMAQYDDTERTVLMIRLANEIDDFRDFGALHCREPERRLDLVRSCGDMVVAMAADLGCKYIETQLEKAFRECREVDINRLPNNAHQYSYILAPNSYRRTTALAVRNRLAEWRRKIKARGEG